jgi:hypothetical protein
VAAKFELSREKNEEALCDATARTGGDRGIEDDELAFAVSERVCRVLGAPWRVGGKHAQYPIYH